MRKKAHTILLFTFLIIFCNGQKDPITNISDNNNTDSNINNIFYKSPAHANLTAFEEVPVSNYTGIPKISVPICSFETQSHFLNIDISLNYHPLSAKPEDRASETGLGWTLFAGGSIIRTPRGYPDDYYINSISSGGEEDRNLL